MQRPHDLGGTSEVVGPPLDHLEAEGFEASFAHGVAPRTPAVAVPGAHVLTDDTGCRVEQVDPGDEHPELVEDSSAEGRHAERRADPVDADLALGRTLRTTVEQLRCLASPSDSPPARVAPMRS